jgi:hypothetical protein
LSVDVKNLGKSKDEIGFLIRRHERIFALASVLRGNVAILLKRGRDRPSSAQDRQHCVAMILELER